MSKIRIAPALAVVVLAFNPGSTGSAQAPAGSFPAVTEELIAEKDAAAPEDDSEDMVSADGRHAAWRTGREKKWGVMLDGQRQAGEFEEVKSLAFSDGGQHLAFAARRGKAWMMVLDGKEPAQTFEKLGEPLFSPDGQRLVHFGKRQGKCSVIVNGEPLGAPFDEPEVAMFSPDGQRLAFVGRRGGKLIVSVDLKEGPPFDVIGGLSFSDDGRHVSYAGADIKTGFGGDKGLGRAVIDGEPGPQFVAIVSGPRFSPDGKRIAYAARRGKDDEVVVVDGQPGPRSASIVAGPRFCNEGRHVAYIVSDAGGKFLVVDGERVGGALLQGADFVSSLTFAPKPSATTPCGHARSASRTRVPSSTWRSRDGSSCG